jgi:hypothetical protein
VQEVGLYGVEGVQEHGACGAVDLRIACCSDWRPATRSSRWVVRKSSRLLSSACSSTASGLIGRSAPGR